MQTSTEQLCSCLSAATCNLSSALTIEFLFNVLVVYIRGQLARTFEICPSSVESTYFFFLILSIPSLPENEFYLLQKLL
jgi:hypothetical protein